MKIFPAIDIKDSKVVRLSQGDYNKVEVFSENPLEIAKSFEQKGAKNLHIVDLDGAKDGELSNFEIIAGIVRNTNLFIQVGGGIRDEERAQKYLTAGVGRVILGTVAVEHPGFVRKMVNIYGDKIAVGVDSKNGKVAIKGWTQVADMDSVEFCRMMQDIGVSTIIYTDIAKDGMMSGTNMEIYKKLRDILRADVIASGGISGESELHALNEMGIYGAIIGKALYTGNIKLEKVLIYE